MCELASWIPNAVAATLRSDTAPPIIEWLTTIRLAIEEYDPLITVIPPEPEPETPDSKFDEILSQLGKEIYKLDEYQRHLVPSEKEVSLSILNIFDECLERMTEEKQTKNSESECESNLSDVSFVTSTPSSVKVNNNINTIFDKGSGTPKPPRRARLKPMCDNSISDMESNNHESDSSSDSESTCWSYKECSTDDNEVNPYAAVWAHSTGFHNSDEILRRVLSQHHATVSRLSFDTASDFIPARYSVYSLHEVGECKDRCVDSGSVAMTPDKPTDDGYEPVRDAITDENIYEEIEYGYSYTDEGCSCGGSVEVESCSISASSEGVGRDSPLYANLRDHDAYAIPPYVIYWKNLLLDPLYFNDDEEDEIDAATGESETNASVLARSFQLAKCFRKFGVKPGDVLALGGRNHINIHIPYYAALMSGMPIAGVDPLFKQAEIKKLFKICSPRIAFCQKELLDAYLGAKEELGLNTEVICFDEGDHSFSSFIEKYDDKEDQEEFQPVIIDRNKHYVWLVSTGGTTGVVKLAAFTHLAFIKKLELLRNVFGPGSGPVNGENKIGLNISPIQWVSSFFAAASSPMLRQTKLQTSGVQTADHIIDMIHKYRPTSAFLSPPNATALVKSQRICDFTSFDNIILSGGKIHKDMHLAIRKRVKPGALVVEMYGQTENLGPIFLAGPEGPIGNCGKYAPGLPEYKLVDPETGKDITEPNVTGELWSKGASMTEYYNNPEETALAFTEDGWFKTGDLLYRDEAGYLYFVERLKMLIKYRMYHIIPPDLEAVIRELPGVHDVSVTSIPHEDDLEHPVACVVRSPGSTLTAQEVKEIVANRLSDSQRLRGGVIFMEQLPMTSTGKVARNELRKLVQTLERE